MEPNDCLLRAGNLGRRYGEKGKEPCLEEGSAEELERLDILPMVAGRRATMAMKVFLFNYENARRRSPLVPH